MKAAANYYNFRLARLEATTNGYDESILLNSAGRVATPHLSSSILESITRRSALDLLSGDLGVAVEERGARSPRWWPLTAPRSATAIPVQSPVRSRSSTTKRAGPTEATPAGGSRQVQC